MTINDNIINYYNNDNSNDYNTTTTNNNIDKHLNNESQDLNKKLSFLFMLKNNCCFLRTKE